VELLFSLDREYLLWSMSLGEIIRHWHYGYKYDMARRGYKMKKQTGKQELKDLRQKYYTPEELAEMEAFNKSRGK